MSIQPLDEGGVVVAEEVDGEDVGGVASSKPKSLQMRVGKVTEKKWRDWSGERECRKETMEAHAEEIWAGVEEETMVAARSWDFECESTV